MSWLLPLRPQGLGTEQVEALPSYFLRLASSHGITPAKLLYHYYQWKSLDSSDETSERSMRLQAHSPVIYVRPNSSTRAMVKLLSDATGQPYETLETMTFLALEYGLNRPVNTFSKTFRWCPLCFKEAHKLGLTPYYKLSWQLLNIEACNIHKSRLRYTCGTCNAWQTGTKFNSSISNCANCGASLWLPTDNYIEHNPAFLGSDVLDMIQCIASNPGIKFPSEGVSKYISEINDAEELTDREVDLRKKIPKEECLIHVDRRMNISLETARRIAFRLDVGLVDLLLGNSKNTSRSFCFGGDYDLPDPIKVKERIRLKKRDSLLGDLKKFNVHERIPPLSLKAVARVLGISIGALSYHFPKEVSKIVARFSEYSAIEREKVLLRIKTTVLDTIVNWDKSNESPISRKAVLKQLYKGRIGSKNALRKEINNVFDDLGLGGG